MCIDLLAGENKPKNNIPEYFKFLKKGGRANLLFNVEFEILYKHYCYVIKNYASTEYSKIETKEDFANYIKDELKFPIKFKVENDVLKVIITIK